MNAALAWKYFFAVPVVMSGVIALCLAISLILASRSQTALRGASTTQPGPAAS
jgi:hypothetical protein